MDSAKERRRYNITSSLIGWAQTKNGPDYGFCCVFKVIYWLNISFCHFWQPQGKKYDRSTYVHDFIYWEKYIDEITDNNLSHRHESINKMLSMYICVCHTYIDIHIRIYKYIYISRMNAQVRFALSFHHDDVIKWKHFRVTGHLCGEFTGHRWIPRTKASEAELWWFLLNKRLSKQWWGWWLETPSRPLWRHCNNEQYAICKTAHADLNVAVTSRECYGVSNHRQLDCLSNSLYRLTSKDTSKLRITGRLWGESTGDRWFSPTNGPWFGKRFPSMMSSCDGSHWPISTIALLTPFWALPKH